MTQQNTTVVALAKRPAADITLSDPKRFKELLEENFNPNQAPLLPRIKWPTGGATDFQRPTTGGTMGVKELTGVILVQHPARAYWPTAGGNDGKAPDCSSLDGITGTGNPGGACATCRHNRWGTGKRQDGSPSRGKACKEIIRVFMQIPESGVPVLVAMPPTSQKALLEYLSLLTGENMVMHQVVTKFSCEKKSSGGFTYAVLKAEAIAPLSQDVGKAVAAAAAELKARVQTAPVSEEDYEVADEDTEPGERRQSGSRSQGPKPEEKPPGTEPPPIPDWLGVRAPEGSNTGKYTGKVTYKGEMTYAEIEGHPEQNPPEQIFLQVTVEAGPDAGVYNVMALRQTAVYFDGKVKLGDSLMVEGFWVFWPSNQTEQVALRVITHEHREAKPVEVEKPKSVAPMAAGPAKPPASQPTAKPGPAVVGKTDKMPF